MERPFAEVDVFTAVPYRGNPLAVVIDGTGLTDAEMQQFANWTNFSETTFVLPPTDPAADYRVRIFTTTTELPFAGHPTLGTCHAWLESGGVPRSSDRVVQECGVGLVTISRGATLAFAAPPLLRDGPLDDATLAEAIDALGIEPTDVADHAWIDNGPGWCGLLLRDADQVLSLRPRHSELKLGVAGMHAVGSTPVEGAAYEVRAFFPAGDASFEDPVTGSLNASMAQWLIGSDRVTAPYVATQGHVLGRAGRVTVSIDSDGQVWIGGDVVTCVRGTVDL